MIDHHAERVAMPEIRLLALRTTIAPSPQLTHPALREVGDAYIGRSVAAECAPTGQLVVTVGLHRDRIPDADKGLHGALDFPFVSIVLDPDEVMALLAEISRAAEVRSMMMDGLHHDHG